MKIVKVLLGIAAVGAIGAVLYIWLGVFSVAADEPHWKPVFKLAELVRERSIAMRASGIDVPPLDDPTMISSGGADYNEMCTGCHLKPGMEESEMQSGLYPQPPDFTKIKPRDPAQMFWIIKHGIKMSAMPAWGPTHDDQRMWAMVAFLQQLPRLTPVQYQILTARADDDEGGHEHGGMEGMDMSGMNMSGSEKSSEHSEAESGGGHSHGGRAAASSPDAPAMAVDSFLKALSAGNDKEAEKWLASDVLVYESGHAETSRDQYVAEHMKGDMDFLSKAKVERLEHASNADGDTAWVTSRSRIRGQSDGKAIDVVSTETMVLRNTPDGWRIAHIHWSSAPEHQP